MANKRPKPEEIVSKLRQVEVFRHTPSISIDPIGFKLGIQRKILNFGVLILFTKIITYFPHLHSPIFDPKEFLFDPV